MSGISTVSASMSTIYQWQVGNNLTGGNYNQVSNAGDLRKQYQLGTNNANNVSGGGDEIFSFYQAIAGGGSATVNLNTMTNILQVANSYISRAKGYQFRLLSGSDDTTITPTPNAASTVTVTNLGVATPSQLDFQSAGTGGIATLTVSNTGAITNVAVNNGGAGYPNSSIFLAVPQLAGGSAGAFICTTNSTGVINTMVPITAAGGTGYTNTQAPVVEAGHYTLATGGAHMYLDPTNTGFLPVSTNTTGVINSPATSSSISCNVKLLNNDPVNATTVEVDVMGCSS